MNGGLRNDVRVEAVAKVDGVDVVAGAKLACADQGTGCVAKEAMPWGRMLGAHLPFQIAVHDSKEDL